MIGRLQEEVGRRGLHTVHAVALPIENLRVPDGSADLVISSYALHHLRDPDKAAVVASAYRWLRPGGGW